MNTKMMTIAMAAGMLGIAPLAMAQNQSQRSQQDQNRVRLDPQAAALIGYDTNNDGRSDVYYWVSQWDVEQIKRDQQRFQRTGEAQQRRMSERRMGMGHPMQQREAFRGQQSQRQFPAVSQQQRMHERAQMQARMQQRQHDPRMMQQRAMQPTQAQRFTGTVDDVTTFRFTNDGKRHVVAKVKLQDGRTVPVHFGPQEKLNVDLKQGKRVSFTGTQGKINGSRIIVAKSVGNQRIFASDQQQSPQGLKQVKVTIQDVRTFKHKGTDHEHVVARVTTDRGERAIIDLGPQRTHKQHNLDLSQGDTLQVLATSGRINDRDVLMARKFKPADRSTVVTVERETRDFSTKNKLKFDSGKNGN